MSLIDYKPLLKWAASPGKCGTVIAAGDALTRMEGRETLQEKSQDMRVVTDFLGHHLDEIATFSALASDDQEEGDLERQAVAIVNAPIDTGVRFTRPVRDAVWLRRFHSGLNAVLTMLDHEYVPPPQAAAAEGQADDHQQ